MIHANRFRFRHRRFTFLPACLLSLAIAGCATTIPRTDTVPPEIRLEITGPGIGRQVMTNPPTENWTAPDGTQLFDLKPDTIYRFLLTVSDRGGVARATIRIPSGFVASNLTGGTIERADDLLRSLTLTGSRADPRTGLILSGRFTTPDTGASNAISFEFLTEGDDFGGASGATNQRFMNVSATVNAL